MLITTIPEPEESVIDVTLRPQTLSEYVGQEKIKKSLSITLQAARERKENIEHLLLYGSPGLGKTTLAHIIAREMGVGIKTTSGPAIERVGDFGAILTNLQDGDVLFIDEIHRLNKTIEEALYPAMEDGKLDIIVGKGPSARTLQIDLPRFTLIGATTRYGSLTAPLRNRFGLVHRLDFYTLSEMVSIIMRSAKILGFQINTEAASVIGERARQTPRIANRLLRRVRDFAQIEGYTIITKDAATRALDALDIDPLGLEVTDRDLLTIMIEKFGGGPVGLNTIATATSEDPQTVEDVYEPFLIKIGFLERTSRGRLVTDAAYRHLGMVPPIR